MMEKPEFNDDNMFDYSDSKPLNTLIDRVIHEDKTVTLHHDFHRVVVMSESNYEKMKKVLETIRYIEEILD